MTQKKNWRQSKARKQVVETTASFVISEGPKLHPALAGPSDFDAAQAEFVKQRPYKHLEAALRQYIPVNRGVQFSENAWSDLFDKFSQASLEGKNPEGPMKLFWYKVGERSEHIQPWIALIPDSYGLEVVKAGIALVLKLAENSVEKRDKIMNAFMILRDAITDAQSKRKSFRTEPAVSKSANQLYITLVGAIEELILCLTPKKSAWSRWIPRFEQDARPKDIDIILQKVISDTKSLERVVGTARDTKIENTERMSKNIEAQTTCARKDIVEVKITGAETKTVVNKILHILEAESRKDNRSFDALVPLPAADRQRQENRQMQELNLMNTQLQAMNDMLIYLLEQQADNRFQVATRKPRPPRSRPLMTLPRLCAILTDLDLDGWTVPEFDAAFQPERELRRVIVQRGRFTPKAHAQLQSLLQHERFAEWIQAHHPDMIAVEANISNAALEKVSAASVFCVTFMTSLAKVQPRTTIIHFCGLHNGPHDSWEGPRGLVRSIILQLIMKLVHLDDLSLECINDPTYLRELERHDLNSLIQALYDFLQQFPPKMTIYCIIDTLSCFDTKRYLADLKMVISYLQDAVNDNGLVPVLKLVVMTPRKYTINVKPLFDPERLITLSPNNARAGGTSGRLIERHLPRSAGSSAAQPRTRRVGKQAEYDPDCDYYDEDEDEGWRDHY